jgi:Zn-dependent M16 (insulinase) family peptidase
MYSYRDPVIKKTFDTFAATGELVLESVQNMTQRDVDDCIIGAMAVLDSPMTVAEKGYTALNFYIGNIDNEYRQAVRSQVLSTTKADFIAFAESFNAIRKGDAGMASLTGVELLESDKSKEIFDTIVTI